MYILLVLVLHLCFDLKLQSKFEVLFNIQNKSLQVFWLYEIWFPNQFQKYLSFHFWPWKLKVSIAFKVKVTTVVSSSLPSAKASVISRKWSLSSTLKGTVPLYFRFFLLGHIIRLVMPLSIYLYSALARKIKKNLFLVPLKGQCLNILRRERIISITGLLPHVPWKAFCLPGWVCHSCIWSCTTKVLYIYIFFFHANETMFTENSIYLRKKN